MSKRLYVIAGEASGDLHASNLMRAMLEEDASIDFRYWGGDEMASVQDGLVKHIRDLAFMGFVEVLMNIRTIFKNISFCKQDILDYKPDAIVLIDYPGFNLRIAEWAHEQGIKVIYYISPQVWAWKQKRVHKIKKVVDKMYVILPFEKDFYKKFDYDVEYVGHPLLDAISKFSFDDGQKLEFKNEHQLDERPIIAVLPGSRKQEVTKKLPVMLGALENISGHQIVVAGAPSLDPEFYQSLMSSDVKIVFQKTYELLSISSLAVVTSGTATLETALFKVPEVVCYKASSISYHIAKRLVKIDYISLVNLIMDQEVVRELIQHECTPGHIEAEVKKIIEDDSYRNSMLANYDKLADILGGGGASKKIAHSLLTTI